ncbi:uncharacterized protein LOC119576671 [Penaeus monodon]|uniref:uncharacterized protein LOC119576671 n=1 Tax=Penaeus monodon TaxID=6687 RepID=UPI0018A70354|nr:uncharacterized protein LOC119576671 [Penaeus monodon]
MLMLLLVYTRGQNTAPFLFAIFIDSVTKSAQKEAQWDILFANDVQSGETKEEVDVGLEEWRAVVQDRGRRVSRKKAEYLFMEDPGMACELKGDKLDKVTEFKYLSSTEMMDGGTEKGFKNLGVHISRLISETPMDNINRNALGTLT